MGYRSRIRSWHLWLVVGVVVVACEAIAPPGELLSEGVDRALEKHPLLTRAAIGVTARHLTNDLPAAVDPFAAVHRVSTRLAQRRSVRPPAQQPV
ncbi:DUF7427 family protein [Nocardia farcinica]|uniref:Uncharacterized protein n=1 Tax=Nocardia farcinica (strain IFM 10152) TaxID=247156 RepID=Q5YSQ6_NOCFA|nr:hypothetical protein NFA_39370 [Nocardia farcinica IFM 10152]